MSAFDGMTFTWSKGFLSGWYGVADTVTGEDHCTFRYNAQGQRIRKTYEYTPPSGSTDNYVKKCEDFMYYHTDGTLQLIVREMESTSGNRYRGHFRFLYGPDGVSGCIYNATETRTPVLYTYVRNALGDIVYICDENYNIKAEYVYDAYGNCEIKNDTTNGFAKNNPFRYRGYFYDTETGFYYCQTRYYNPAWGRFISMDDVDYVDPQAVSGLNLYAYCNGDPVNFSDPTGHSLLAIWIIIGLAAVAGGGIGAAIGRSKEHTGGELVKDILIGMSLGAFAGGAIISGSAAIAGAFHATTFLGAPVLQAFAAGALAFDQFTMITLPLLGRGGEVESIEYEQPKPIDIPKPMPTRPYYK